MPEVAHRESSGGARETSSGTGRQGGNQGAGAGNSGNLANMGASGALLSAGTLLRVGANGPQVRALQTLLNENGASVTVDGDFGRMTRAAVMVFQRARGLEVDGVVGSATIGALNSGRSSAPTGGGGAGAGAGAGAGSAAGTLSGSPMLQRGARGPQVTLLQQLLVRNGVRVAVDGDFGLDTHRAVRVFQREQRIFADGVVGPQTAALLNQGARGGGGQTTTPAPSTGSQNDTPAPSAGANERTLTGSPPLKYGDAGRRVTLLQQLLNQKGAQLFVDGEFGGLTSSAVRRFQQANRLPVDGVVGTTTANLLNRGGANIAPAEQFDGGADELEVRNAVLSAARSHLGAPYYWGADGPNMFDCSGFVLFVLRQDTGLVNWGDDTASGIKNRVPRTTNPQKGDLVFYTGSGGTSHITFATGSGSQTLGAGGGGSRTRGDDPNARVKYTSWNDDGRSKSFGSISNLIQAKLARGRRASA